MVVCVASGDYINFFAHHSNREPDGLHYVARLFVCVESMQAGLYVGNATLGRTVGSQRRCSWLVGQVAQSRASFNPMNTAKFGDSSGVPGKLCPKRSEEHTSELQSLAYLVCRLLLEKKNSRRRR